MPAVGPHFLQGTAQHCIIISHDHWRYFLSSNLQEVVIDGQPTHQTNYDVRKHVRVYLGLNNMPLERKDDDPELVYGVERAVSGRAQNGIRPQIIFVWRDKNAPIFLLN